MSFHNEVCPLAVFQSRVVQILSTNYKDKGTMKSFYVVSKQEKISNNVKYSFLRMIKTKVSVS